MRIIYYLLHLIYLGFHNSYESMYWYLKYVHGCTRNEFNKFKEEFISALNCRGNG